MNKQLLLFTFLPLFLLAQQSIDVTGRISVNTINVEYDQKSDIKPDSVAGSEYGKTTLIPGLQQTLNISLFARTQNLDISLLGDIRNNDWNKLDFNNQNSIDRLSLSLRFANHEIVLGDFYESGSEFFLQSREIRGGKVALQFDNVWNRFSFIELNAVAGLAQKAIARGERLNSLYKQFETSGQFRRMLAAATVKAGERSIYELGLHYLYAKDDKGSIKESLNDPLGNQNMGLDAAVYLWKNRVKLFAEGYYSKKDTADLGSTDDYSYKSGFDFRYEQFKLVASWQRLGFNYYTAGYPFLLNDRQGLRLQAAYNIPDIMIVSTDAEQYDNNLENDKSTPVTTTRIAEVSATTALKNLPEITLLYGFRDDLSNAVFNEQEEKTRTDKISRKYETRIAYDFNFNRISLTTIYLDLDDKSKIAGGAPLGTEQLIGSLNFYTRPTNTFFISGGAVYSRLLLTDSKESRNYFLYQSSRWDIIPRKLIFESTINVSKNDSKNSGADDLLSNYWQADGRLSLEFFFIDNLSLKVIGGTNTRKMDFSTSEALAALQSPDIEPTFFNGNESFNAIIYGAEINWIF